MILTTGSRATTTDCDHVAKALVRKYPFLKEYVSLRCLLYIFIIFINCFYNSILGLITFMYGAKMLIENQQGGKLNLRNLKWRKTVNSIHICACEENQKMNILIKEAWSYYDKS